MIRFRSLFMLICWGMLQPPFADAVELHEDVVYAKRGERELKLDLAEPDGGGEMRPAILCIHGGAWAGGNRNMYRPIINNLAEHGYVAATIDYRLTGVAPWPAQIEDVQTALKWLIENADKYNIDPERIGVTGGSAGGHLALMVGMMPKEREEATRVRAIVNFFGPADMSKIEYIEHARGVVEALVDGPLEEKLDVMRHASPVTYVDRTDPAVLTYHGTDDEIVPILQARLLHTALEKHQIPNELVVMEGVGHGLTGYEDKAMQQMRQFFDAYLRPTDMPLITHKDFTTGASRWETTDDTAWKHVDKNGRAYFSLIKDKSDYEPKVRSPWNVALLKDVEVGDFVLDVDLRSTHEPYGHQSLCLFFGHQDPSHFYYVHFGRQADAHANSIFLVNNEPRVSIAQERTDGTDWSRGWHKARIVRDASSGKIEVYFDDMQRPVMSTVDKTLTHGRIGIGSFDDTGDFDAIRLWGKKK